MSNLLRIHMKLLPKFHIKSPNICFFRFNICLNHKKNTLSLISVRCLTSNQKSYQKYKSNHSLAERQNASQNEVTIGAKVKQTTQDITYFGVILLGVSVTAIILWAIFRELFSSVSPSVLYSNALKLCKSDVRVVEAIGDPIKGFGEMSSRGRRRHVSSLEYEKDGQQVIRVKFYLKGSKTSGTVHLEAFKRSSKSKYRYLFVELDNSRHVIVLEDNRRLEDKSGTTLHSL